MLEPSDLVDVEDGPSTVHYVVEGIQEKETVLHGGIVGVPVLQVND